MANDDILIVQDRLVQSKRKRGGRQASSSVEMN
jgi:hypothetical protein